MRISPAPTAHYYCTHRNMWKNPLLLWASVVFFLFFSFSCSLFGDLYFEIFFNISLFPLGQFSLMWAICMTWLSKKRTQIYTWNEFFTRRKINSKPSVEAPPRALSPTPGARNERVTKLVVNNFELFKSTLVGRRVQNAIFAGKTVCLSFIVIKYSPSYRPPPSFYGAYD